MVTHREMFLEPPCLERLRGNGIKSSSSSLAWFEISWCSCAEICVALDWVLPIMLWNCSSSFKSGSGFLSRFFLLAKGWRSVLDVLLRIDFCGLDVVRIRLHCMLAHLLSVFVQCMVFLKFSCVVSVVQSSDFGTVCMVAMFRSEVF